MRVLGINAIYHDPAAALIVDGVVVAAAEEERFSRRKHGKRPVPFAAWELPEQSAAWCLARAGLTPADLDAVTYSFDPALAIPAHELGIDDDPWDFLRLIYAERAPGFLTAALPGLDSDKVRFVAHHVAHAASAGLAAPMATSSVLVLDGRGERASHLAGHYATGGTLDVIAQQSLPHSLGLLYESVTEHLGFLRSSDEYKVMAMASYGKPRFIEDLRARIYTTGDGGFRTEPVDWSEYASRLRSGDDWTSDHADLAASVQQCVEEVLIDLACWLHGRTGDRALVMAGGVALNCVANSRVLDESPFDEVWVQPAAGDAGTALGGALHVAAALGDPVTAMPGADLGREWTDDEIEAMLIAANISYERPRDIEEAFGTACDPTDLQLRLPHPANPNGQRFVLIHPGAAFASRRWPAERFAVVAQHLVDLGYDIRLTGSEDEMQRAYDIAERANLAHACVIAGRTSLTQLATVSAQADLVVSGDTGIAHLAVATRTPSVTLFGPISPRLWGPPRSERHVAIWTGDPAGDQRPGDPWGALVDPRLADITVDQVLDACTQLLERAGAWTTARSDP